MAKHQRIESDSITQNTRVSYRVDQPLSRGDAEDIRTALRRRSHNNSFETKISALEPDLRAVATGADTPRYGSRGYYAQEMLKTIENVRFCRDLGSRGGIDAALAAAMRVGWLAAECWAKHEWSVVDVGVRHRERQRQKGRLGGLKKGERSKAHDRTIARYAKLWNDSYELQDTFRSASAYVQSKTKLSLRTIQARLKALRETRK